MMGDDKIFYATILALFAFVFGYPWFGFFIAAIWATHGKISQYDAHLVLFSYFFRLHVNISIQVEGFCKLG